MKQFFKILMFAALALPFSGCDVEYDPIVVLPDVVLEDSGMTTVPTVSIYQNDAYTVTLTRTEGLSKAAEFDIVVDQTLLDDYNELNGASFGMMPASGYTISAASVAFPEKAKTATFTIGIILVLLTLFIVLNIINSRTGRAIMAIRDNRIAAESVGINITKYKLMAFTISASLAGVAGVLYAHNLATLAATPKSFGYNMSIMILVFVVLGGIGNIRGSMIAAVILTLLPEMLRSLNNYRMLIYAVVLIAMMLLTSSPKAIEVRGRIFSSFRKKKTEGEA